LRGLLDRLGTHRKIDMIESIGANLNVLLNSKLGNSGTVPDFGVIDFVDVVHEMPRSVARLQDSIRATIQNYEPRLKGVVVRFVPSDDPLRLTFEVSARLVDDRKRSVHFDTRLEAGGRFAVT